MASPRSVGTRLFQYRQADFPVSTVTRIAVAGGRSPLLVSHPPSERPRIDDASSRATRPLTAPRVLVLRRVLPGIYLRIHRRIVFHARPFLATRARARRVPAAPSAGTAADDQSPATTPASRTTSPPPPPAHLRAYLPGRRFEFPSVTPLPVGVRLRQRTDYSARGCATTDFACVGRKSGSTSDRGLRRGTWPRSPAHRAGSSDARRAAGGRRTAVAATFIRLPDPDRSLPGRPASALSDVTPPSAAPRAGGRTRSSLSLRTQRLREVLRGRTTIRLNPRGSGACDVRRIVVAPTSHFGRSRRRLEKLLESEGKPRRLRPMSGQP